MKPTEDKHCGTCRYFGWLKLERWCRHPDHPAKLKKWPGLCGDWLDSETKDTALKVYPAPVEVMTWRT